MKVGINGAGRIGRNLLRLLWQEGRHEVVHVNDLNDDTENLAYLLKYDSVYGRFSGAVTAGEGELRLEDENRRWRIGTTARPDTREVAWADRGVEVLFEATGAEGNERAASDLTTGSLRYVVVTQASRHAEATVVFGVNADSVSIPGRCVLAASTCDSVAISPVLSTLSREFGVQRGFLVTMHPWLSYQNLADGPLRSVASPGRFTGDYALGRASPGAVIPKSTTAGETVEALVPELAGRLLSVSYRVPTASVCYADLGLHLEREVEAPEVREVLGGGAPYIRLSDEPLVSVDFVGERASVVVDCRWLAVADGYLRMTLAYDNEQGYCRRLRDLLHLLDKA